MPVTIKLNLKTEELNRALDQNAPKRMLEAVNELRNEVLKTLSGSRSGRVYRVPGTKRTYVASAPGQAPATASSGLRQSVKSEVEGRGTSVIGKVKAEAAHALPLEFGTRRVKARPFMKPSFDKSLDAIRSILTRKWF